MTTRFGFLAPVLGGVILLLGVGDPRFASQDKASEPARIRPYFYFDAETLNSGAPLPQPPFFPQPWKEADSDHPKRGRVFADPTAPQGKNVMLWDVAEAKTTELLHEVQFDRLPEAQGKDYYYACFVRYDRKGGKDIWHTGENEASADKGFEVKGDGIRWIVSFGSWGHTNEQHRFTTWVGNPTYHVNPKLEVYDAYYPNQNGYSQQTPIPLEYEKWHAVVFKMKWATDDSGEIGLWINGKKILEHKGLKTAQAPGTFERLQFFGTIAQPAYDAPPHLRKVDALIFTDNWQDIVDGGYLNAEPGKDKE